MHCLNVISLLLVVSLSQLDPYIAVINSQATKLKSAIWRISLAFLLPKGCYLIKAAILRREHTIFFVSPPKYLSVPNNEIGAKLLFHSYKTTG